MTIYIAFFALRYVFLVMFSPKDCKRPLTVSLPFLHSSLSSRLCFPPTFKRPFTAPLPSLHCCMSSRLCVFFYNLNNHLHCHCLLCTLEGLLDYVFPHNLNDHLQCHCLLYTPVCLLDYVFFFMI